MRVLLVSAPLVGHVFPMVPLARALARAGHEVLVATGGDALTVRAAGLPIADVAPGLRFGSVAARTMLRHPLIARAEATGTAGTRGVSLLFGAVNARMLDPLAALADRFVPDLVVYEPLAVAGAVVAAERGVPAVLHETMLFDGLALARATAARLGRGPVPAGTVLTVAPPSVVGKRAGSPMRAVPYGGTGDVPSWLRERPGRPRILVTRSTVAGPGSGRLAKAAMAVAGQVEAEIVFARPGRVPAGLPDSVRTTGWVPVPEVLPTCSGLVHSGGAGATLAALAAGVPQLIVPGPGDRPYNAGLVAARGAGLAIAAREPMAAALTRLVSDEALATAAAEVRDEMAAMPAPEVVVPHLETLPTAPR